MSYSMTSPLSGRGGPPPHGGLVAVSSAEDAELNAMWARVRDTVVRMAGGDVALASRSLSIDDVLAELDRVHSAEAKKSDKYQGIKAAFWGTLKCLETVGGIVANGASNVFGPAETCFNALTFVITAYSKYEKVFESLSSLFERCTMFFERLDEYIRAGMDAKLTRVACQHLQLFVEICEKAQQLSRGRIKLLTFTKVFFLDDDGISPLLARMASLVDKEHGLVAAQTYRQTVLAVAKAGEAALSAREALAVGHGIGSKVSAMFDDRTRQRQREERNRRRDMIAEKILAGEAARGSELANMTQNILNKYGQTVVDGTGKWILDEPLFRSWCRRRIRQNRCSSLRVAMARERHTCS